MLTLFLLRHAKAEAPSPHVDDEVRPLTESGREAARRLGSFMQSDSARVDLALVSDSTRTRQTSACLAETLGAFDERIEADLYNAPPSVLQKRVAQLGGDVRNLMVIGHNPGICELALTLAQHGDPQEIARIRKRFPPCSLAVLSFAEDKWREALSKRDGQLIGYYMPDDIGGAG